MRMRVLVVDDEPDIRELLALQLRTHVGDVVAVDSAQKALQILRGPNAPRIALIDWMMPDMNGIDLCREIRRFPVDDYVYTIMLTAKNKSHDLVEALEAGADDYIRKPHEVRELLARLRAAERIIRVQTTFKDRQDALEERASRDSLTELENRAAVLNRLDAEIDRVDRETGLLGLALIDLDHFKRINDSHGHQVGDTVLRVAAKTMAGAIRKYDCLGRYGGEEFLLIMPGCDLTRSITQAERLRMAVERIPAASIEKLHLTASFGVSAIEGGMTPDAESLLRAADVALYRAKQAGRNAVEFLPYSEVKNHPELDVFSSHALDEES